MIVSAAIRLSPMGPIISVPKPKRHSDIFALLQAMDIRLVRGSYIQGFLTDEGKFLDRYEAMNHVLEVHQPIRYANGDTICKKSDVLFSEDLW